MQIGALPPVPLVSAVDQTQLGSSSGALDKTQAQAPDPIRAGRFKPAPPLHPTIEDTIQITDALLNLRWADPSA